MPSAPDMEIETVVAAPAAATVIPGWFARMRHALTFGVNDRDTILVALAGFMLRGGLVLLLLPGIVLPSVIGIAAAVGVGFFGIDGRPTGLFFEIVMVVSLLGAAWLLAVCLLGSIFDMWLVESAQSDGSMRESRPVPDLSDLIDMGGIRAICLLAPAAALAWAGERIYSAAYDEFLTPSDLATPIVFRVLARVALPLAVVLVAWLASEAVGAIAIRRMILTDCGVWRALTGALLQAARRPLTTIETAVLTYSVSAIVLGTAMGLTALAFEWCRMAARNQDLIAIGGIDLRPTIFVLASVVFAAAWIAAAVIAGAASAARSAAFTAETVDACRSRGQRPNDCLGTIGRVPR